MWKKNHFPSAVLPMVVFSLSILFFLGACADFRMNKSKAVMYAEPTHNLPAAGLDTGWQNTYGKLDLSAIEKFLATEKIAMIAFVNENGTMYVTDIKGNEIGYEAGKDGRQYSRWCKVDGTQLPEGCLDVKAHNLTNVNHMTTIFGHGSPYQVIIQVDGYWVCWDLVDHCICQ